MTIERTQAICRASWVGIIGNAVLALLKISIGLIAGSLAVVGDGIDSTADIVMSVISLFTAIIISKPPDNEHPYGHFRAETIATSILAFIMFFVGVELLKTSIKSFAAAGSADVPSRIALYVTVISIAGKIFLSLYLRRVGRKISSNILVANGKNMQNDILISSGVLAGLVFIVFLKLPIIDSLLGLAISIWILFTAVRIFLEINTELMDGVRDKSVYELVFNAVDKTKGAINPHRTRIRKLSSLYVIDLDIEVDGNMNLTQAHEIAMEVERIIKEKLDNVYDIMVHVEPKGNIEEKEKFGVAGASIEDKP